MDPWPRLLTLRAPFSWVRVCALGVPIPCVTSPAPKLPNFFRCALPSRATRIRHTSDQQINPSSYTNIPYHSRHGSSVRRAHINDFRIVQMTQELTTSPHQNRLGGLNANEQRELEQRMQKRQVKEFVSVSNKRSNRLQPPATSLMLTLPPCV